MGANLQKIFHSTFIFTYYFVHIHIAKQKMQKKFWSFKIKCYICRIKIANLHQYGSIIKETTMKSMVFGIDISLNQTVYAIVDVRGRIIDRDAIKTYEYPDINGFVRVLCERLVEMAEKNCGLENIRSIGVSSPSGNFLSGCIENSPNMPWKGVIPLSAMIRDQVGLAVAVGNDCHVHCLSESIFGNAHGMNNFAIVSLGHGMGVSSFNRGKVLLGNNGFAGELGHTCIEEDGRQCECGLKGCLEAYVAEKGILRTAIEIMNETDKPSMMREIENLTPKLITKCCERGDELAIEVFRRTGKVLGRGLATLAAVTDPEAIILLGGISRAGKWLLDPTQESFDNHLFRNLRGKVELMLSGLEPEESMILGASALAWQVKEYSLFR